jgi:hypothetical protein
MDMLKAIGLKQQQGIRYGLTILGNERDENNNTTEKSEKKE